ncbi:MAG TPA: VOC family protein [Allosphingosinicella sp.]|nr:VOC family protein [Allosphingosinicella sp.]
MLSHVSLGTNDLDRAARFYDPVLAALDIKRRHRDERIIGYGGSIMFFSVEVPLDGAPASVGNGAHVAFWAETRAQVDAFHAAALAHGGSDAGPPGVRPAYDPHYYAAFVRDPDGNKLEAVSFAAA